jgi:hypothetical protein
METLVEMGTMHKDMPALSTSERVLISSTKLQNCFVCQPQKVNTSGKVFGGFLSKSQPRLMVLSFDLSLFPVNSAPSL